MIEKKAVNTIPPTYLDVMRGWLIRYSEKRKSLLMKRNILDFFLFLLVNLHIISKKNCIFAVPFFCNNRDKK